MWLFIFCANSSLFCHSLYLTKAILSTFALQSKLRVQMTLQPANAGHDDDSFPEDAIGKVRPVGMSSWNVLSCADGRSNTVIHSSFVAFLCSLSSLSFRSCMAAPRVSPCGHTDTGSCVVGRRRWGQTSLQCTSRSIMSCSQQTPMKEEVEQQQRRRILWPVTTAPSVQLQSREECLCVFKKLRIYLEGVVEFVF